MADDEIPRVVVTAAVIERDGAFLITRRPSGVHLEGFWEFPGGKCDCDEPHDACLRREILEELAVDVAVRDEVFTVSHAYPDRIVELHFLRCELLGTPRPVLGQDMRWVSRGELTALDFPPADGQLIDLLQRGA